MNTRKVIITAALIASLSMLAFAQQRQAGNSQGAAKGMPQMQAQLQQQNAQCPYGGEFAEDATRNAALKCMTLPTHPQVHRYKCNNNYVTPARMSSHNPFF